MKERFFFFFLREVKEVCYQTKKFFRVLEKKDKTDEKYKNKKESEQKLQSTETSEEESGSGRTPGTSKVRLHRKYLYRHGQYRRGKWKNEDEDLGNDLKIFEGPSIEFDLKRN